MLSLFYSLHGPATDLEEVDYRSDAATFLLAELA
jgi:hypothetical protein